MIHFKACPKCYGDLYLNEDSFGEYFHCLQCGYMLDVEQGGEATVPAMLLPDMTKSEELMHQAA